MMSEQQPRRKFLGHSMACGTMLVLAGASLPRCVCRALAGDAPPGNAGNDKPIADLAYCGFNCQVECDVYKATRENDRAVKTAIAKRWAENYGVDIKPDDVACDGCRIPDGRVGYHCGSICDVRKCGRARGVISCAACNDFPSCAKSLWKNWPEMRKRTEARRSQLKVTGADA